MAELLESDIERILSVHHDLIESGLKLKGRQITVAGKRADLVFNDKIGDTLIVELKKGVIKRQDIAQILEYDGLLCDENNPTRLMLIGNIVPPPIRRSLERHGMEWKELPQNKLIDYLKEHDKKLYEEYSSKIADTDIPEREVQKIIRREHPDMDEKFITIDKSKYNKNRQNQKVWKDVAKYCTENLGKIETTLSGNVFKISKVDDDRIILRFTKGILYLDRWRFINLFDYLSENQNRYFNFGSYQKAEFRKPGLDDFLKQVDGNLNGLRSAMYVISILSKTFPGKFEYVNERPQRIKYIPSN